MPSYKRSRYAKVNERRRKQEWNRRSTGQLARYRRERAADLNAPISERGRRRTRHGLVNTGYMAALLGSDRTTREEARLMVEEERARVAALRGEVPVAEARHPDGSFKAREHTRTLPSVAASPIERKEAGMLVEPTEDGKWLAHLPNGSTRKFDYKVDADSTARALV